MGWHIPRLLVLVLAARNSHVAGNPEDICWLVYGLAFSTPPERGALLARVWGSIGIRDRVY